MAPSGAIILPDQCFGGGAPASGPPPMAPHNPPQGSGGGGGEVGVPALPGFPETTTARPLAVVPKGVETAIADPAASSADAAKYVRIFIL